MSDGSGDAEIPGLLEKPAEKTKRALSSKQYVLIMMLMMPQKTFIWIKWIKETISVRLFPPTVYNNPKWFFQVKLLTPDDAERIQVGQLAFVSMIYTFFSGIQPPRLHT